MKSATAPLKYFLTLTFLFYVNATASENGSLLTKDRQDIQNYKQQELDAAYEKQKQSWISPLDVILNYSQNQSPQNGSLGKSKSAYLNLNQDIFRSGGIYYAIDYAKSQKAYNQTMLDLENASYTQSIFNALLNIKRVENQIEQSELKLKNYEIEIFLKRQQYEAGDVDITPLNSAIMDRNRELKNLMNYKTSLNNLKVDFQRVSDKKEREINLPHFELISRELFLEHNYNIAKNIHQSSLLTNQYKVTRAGYLPKVTLTGQYGYMDYENRDLSLAYDSDYYNVGLQLKIPLDVKTSSALEEAKSVYLRSLSELLDQKREQSAYYKKIESNIASYQEYIELTKKNIELYDELIDVTSKAVSIGYKAGYDLKTLQNTKSIDEYEIKINEINIQLELVKLHFLVKEAHYAN